MATTMNVIQGNSIVESLFLLICEVAQAIPWSMSASHPSYYPLNVGLHWLELCVLRVQTSSLTILGAF